MVIGQIDLFDQHEVELPSRLPILVTVVHQTVDRLNSGDHIIELFLVVGTPVVSLETTECAGRLTTHEAHGSPFGSDHEEQGAGGTGVQTVEIELVTRLGSAGSQEATDLCLEHG